MFFSESDTVELKEIYIPEVKKRGYRIYQYLWRDSLHWSG